MLKVDLVILLVVAVDQPFMKGGGSPASSTCVMRPRQWLDINRVCSGN